MAAYMIDDFCRDLDRIVVEQQGHDRAIVAAAKPLLEKMLADMSWLDPKYTRGVENASVQYRLRKHPDNLYFISATVFWNGYATPVHDHMTWGLVGLWHGTEQEERFTHDGERTTPAKLRHVGTVVAAPGSVTTLIPPAQEIHRITNISPTPSYSIHVYGTDIDGMLRHRFDLETDEVKPFTVAVQTAV